MQENADLRRQLDDTEEQLETLEQKRDVLQGQTPYEISQRSVMQNFSHNDAPPPSPRIDSSMCRGDRDTFDQRRTAGVHGMRLLRNIFDGWTIACQDKRMVGVKSSFSCLPYLISQNNQNSSMSTVWSVVRLRREDLEIARERLGSGSFAEVFRGEIKIRCAVKKMRQQPLPPKVRVRVVLLQTTPKLELLFLFSRTVTSIASQTYSPR